MQFDTTDSTDSALEVLSSLYSAIEKKLESIQIMASNSRYHLVKSTRWFNIYEIEDGILICVWKYNHLFKVLEPEVRARMYKYYPANLDLFVLQIASKRCYAKC